MKRENPQNMTYPANYKYTKEHEWIEVNERSVLSGLQTTRRIRWATLCLSICRRWETRLRRVRASVRWSQ